MRAGDIPRLGVPRGLEYGTVGVPWLPRTLRDRWLTETLGSAIPDVAPGIASVTAADLDETFSPPPRVTRLLIAALVKWMDSRGEAICDVPVASPVSARLDVSNMSGWAHAVLVAWSGGEILELDRPPTFGELSTITAVRGRDVLEAACLVEAALKAALPSHASDRRRLEEDEPSALLADELREWMIEQLGLDPERADALVARFGVAPDDTPTLAQVGDRLGVTRERIRQIIGRVEAGLAEHRPRFSGVDRLRAALLGARQRGALSVAASLAEVTSDPPRLAAFLALIGERRLASLIRDSSRPLDPEFIRAARQLVHKSGAATVDRLMAALDGWSFDREEFLYAYGGDREIRVVDSVAVSLRREAALATGLKKALSATNPQSIVAAYPGALRLLRFRNAPVLPTLEEFKTFLLTSPEFSVEGEAVTSLSSAPEPEGLEALLLRAIDNSEAGLVDRDSLARYARGRGYSEASVQQYGSYSPVLELACTGVFRRRGAMVDFGRAEQMRRELGRRSRWAPWGWLGPDRFWIQCRITEDGLKPRPPRDLLELLLGRSFPTLAVDRTELGLLKFDHQGSVVWALQPSVDNLREESSVLEFRVGAHPSVALLSGESADDEDQYPGDVDGCVLVEGRWWMVVHVDEALLEGAACLLPNVLVSRLGLGFGDEAELLCDGGASARVRREAHAGVLIGLGARLRASGVAPGWWVRIAIAPSRLDLHQLGRTSMGTAEDLMVRVGLDSDAGPPKLFRAIGSALGLGGISDRGDVVAALHRRGRPDLARLAERAHQRRGSSGSGSVASLSVMRDGEDLVVRDACGRLMAARPGGTPGGTSPIGLNWVEVGEAAGAPNDPVWQRWISAYVRAWFSAVTSQPVTFELDGRDWLLGSRRFPRLVEAMEAVDVAGGTGVLPVSTNVCFPETGLGFIHALREAASAGLRTLTVTQDGVVCQWNRGGRSTGLFLEALMPHMLE